jgi:hypothetical protein
MPRAIELLRQGRREELWQMCCGFLSLTLDEFMDIQKRLLLEQLELLNGCALGEKIMHGAKPKTVEEFRQQVPLTNYKDYCPELLEKREDILPAKADTWVHSSGRSGEYPCKWVPIPRTYWEELSVVMYGIGLISVCDAWGDVSRMSHCPKIVYAVAPRPYMSGAMAVMIGHQTPTVYYPPLEEAEGLSFEDRIKLGFKQALSKGFDYFFGLSIVLVSVGEKFSQASSNTGVLSLLSQPRALFRLARGMVKSRMAGRPMLPRDLWSLKGVISGGVDSGVFKDKIKDLWGRYPLDLYGCTEGSLIATQTWDYDSMTFVPNLNFLEFIPEEENLKWQLDRSYQPKTVLLDEVKPGENYELVFTNFHGGALVRYRVGDMIRITSLRNEKLGIATPQMAFIGRADDIIDFGVIRLTEKTIWQAVESTGIPYVDWVVQKEAGENMALHLFVELQDGCQASAEDVASAVYNKILESDDDKKTAAEIRRDFENVIDFRLKATLLPSGTFANFIEQRQAEGADLAHLKPPHINPSDRVLTLLVTKPEKARVAAEGETEANRVAAP